MTTSTNTTASSPIGLGSAFQQATTTASSKTKDLFADNSTMYINLLLTQLKNQDPTNPTDTDKMVQNFATLNNTQQAIATNTNLENLIAMQKTSQGSQLASFINKKIEYMGNNFYNSPGTTNNFSYINSAAESTVDIQIRDSNNNIVKDVAGNTAIGTNTFAWDGTDNDGNAVSAGNYNITVTNKDSTGTIGTSTTLLQGVATGVDFTSADPVLYVGNGTTKIAVTLDKISAVLGDQVADTNIPTSGS